MSYRIVLSACRCRPLTATATRQLLLPQSVRRIAASSGGGLLLPRRTISSLLLPSSSTATLHKSLFNQQQRRTMFIQTSATPNEDALQFIPGVPVLGDPTAEGGGSSMRTVEYNTPREALKSPLATRLFSIEGVRGIMYGSDFVTVRKDPDYPWQLMKPDIYAAIMDHFSSGRALIRPQTAEDESGDNEKDSMSAVDGDSEIVAEIKELLESRVRPAIQEDGGDLDFVSFNEGTGVVSIRLRGACRGCASSTVTLKHGVEGMLSYYIPEVTGVEDVGDELEAQANKEFSKMEAKLDKQ